MNRSRTSQFVAVGIALLLGGAIFFFQNCAKAIKQVNLPSTNNQNQDELIGLIDHADAYQTLADPRTITASATGFLWEPKVGEYKASIRLDVIDSNTQSPVCSNTGRADLENAESPGHGYQIGCQGQTTGQSMVLQVLGKTSSDSEYVLVDQRTVTVAP